MKRRRNTLIFLFLLCVACAPTEAQTKPTDPWVFAYFKEHLPEAAKHGSFFHVTEAEAQCLLARHDR